VNLKEIEAGLPNGFHDALLHRLEWDLENRTAVLELSLWTGDLREQQTADRERHERQRLVLQGVRFFHIESPRPGYPYDSTRSLRVELVDVDRNHPLLREQPAGVFGARLFVQEWNAFVHLAAEDADLVPLARAGA
jgi:hypothetical protein